MCLIVLSPPGNEGLTRAKAHVAFMRNPDGAGFAYSSNEGRLTVQKGYMKFQEFWKAYRKVRTAPGGKEVTMMVHFRWSTHGDESEANCHPFLVGTEGSVAMAHNGVLPCQTLHGDPRSDTRLFAEEYASKMDHWEFFEPSITEEIRKWALGSKLVFLDGFGRFEILGEGLGYWRDGSWYSNNGAEVFTRIVRKPRKIEGYSTGSWRPVEMADGTTRYYLPGSADDDFDFEDPSVLRREIERGGHCDDICKAWGGP